jgi:hypothetical protein
MHRFTQKAMQDEETTKYEPLRKFVNSFFSENHEMRQKQLSVMTYIQHISEALKFSDNFFATSYYIERDKTSYFALFFMSSSILVFKKFLK